MNREKMHKRADDIRHVKGPFTNLKFRINNANGVLSWLLINVRRYAIHIVILCMNTFCPTTLYACVFYKFKAAKNE